MKKSTRNALLIAGGVAALLYVLGNQRAVAALARGIPVSDLPGDIFTTANNGGVAPIITRSNVLNSMTVTDEQFQFSNATRY